MALVQSPRRNVAHVLALGPSAGVCQNLDMGASTAVPPSRMTWLVRVLDDTRTSFRNVKQHPRTLALNRWGYLFCPSVKQGLLFTPADRRPSW